MELIKDTFVLVAPDCPVDAGVPPKPRGQKPTVPVLQHALLTEQPYTLTLEELMYAVHVRREDLSAAVARRQDRAIRERLFGKPYPCMRASSLPKSHGWGVHHDARGRIAIYGVETDDYAGWSKEKHLDVVVAMRSKRA